MKWYKCSLQGVNFPGELINESKLIGFYTTRFVEANTVDEAELIAISLLRNDKKLKLPSGTKPPKDAKISFEKVEEIDINEVPGEQMGFTFYVMDSLGK